MSPAATSEDHKVRHDLKLMTLFVSIKVQTALEAVVGLDLLWHSTPALTLCCCGFRDPHPSSVAFFMRFLGCQAGTADRRFGGAGVAEWQNVAPYIKLDLLLWSVQAFPRTSAPTAPLQHSSWTPLPTAASQDKSHKVQRLVLLIRRTSLRTVPRSL